MVFGKNLMESIINFFTPFRLEMLAPFLIIFAAVPLPKAKKQYGYEAEGKTYRAANDN